VSQLAKAVFSLRVFVLVASMIIAVGLFVGGFVLLTSAPSGFAGLAMIFAGVVVYVVPIIFKSEILRDRMTIRIMLELTAELVPCYSYA
jgi:hypothetical protein